MEEQRTGREEQTGRQFRQQAVGRQAEQKQAGQRRGEALWQMRARKRQRYRQKLRLIQMGVAAAGCLLIFCTGVLVGKNCSGNASQVHARETEREEAATAAWGETTAASRSRTGELPSYVDEQYLTVNPYSRPGIATDKIRSVVIHYIGNPGTTAQQNRNYFESLATDGEGVSMSSNFVIGLEGEVIACVPPGEVAYASNSRNHDTISIENCHPDATGAFTEETYRSLVRLTAWLCDAYQLDPRDGGVIRHHDVTGKDCPKYFVDHPEAWEQFLEDVEEQMGG